MWGMLKDDVKFYKRFYNTVPFPTFIKWVMGSILSYIPLALFYLFCWTFLYLLIKALIMAP